MQSVFSGKLNSDGSVELEEVVVETSWGRGARSVTVVGELEGSLHGWVTWIEGLWFGDSGRLEEQGISLSSKSGVGPGVFAESWFKGNSES